MSHLNPRSRTLRDLGHVSLAFRLSRGTLDLQVPMIARGASL